MPQVTLAASAARTASGDTGAIRLPGYWRRLIAVLDLTAATSIAGDTCDIYIDVSLDGVKWLPAVHFGQQLGNGAAKTEFAVLDPTNPGTATVVATSNPAVSTVRPGAFGPYIRGRWVVVDGGGTNTFTFSLNAYVT